MEVAGISNAEGRAEDPGSTNEDLPTAQPNLSPGRQPHGPTGLWETLEQKYLEFKQLVFRSPEERQKSLLGLLPLFLKAWEHSVGIICFPSLQRLAEDVSNQLAQEIQGALAGKPAEQARVAAQQLLWWKGDVDQAGYLLLKSVYVLTGTDSETLGSVVDSGLPALLLQCLYLFFVFPVEKDELFESDLQVQRMFVQMLLNICSDSQGLEGLLSGSELQALLIATTCLWEHSCCLWKEPTFCVLRAISKAQSLSVIQYLQDMDCLKISLQNLSRLADTLPAPEVSEAVSLLLDFVRDSYPISSALFLEFENGDGYPLLLKVLLRYDGLTQNEVDPHLEELLGQVMWLTTCGTSELKVFDSIIYPQLEGFKFHHEAAGVTIKNLQAFQVLQNVFHKASDPLLCTQVLSAIRTTWTWNARNFFLLEWTLQPLSQFVEIVHLKPAPVQAQFFQLLEVLVFELSYVPHEILRKVQRLIKESPEPLCTLTALQSIHRIAGGDPLFADIFRDSGFLGLLLAQLRRQAKILRKSGNKEAAVDGQDLERELTCVMLKTVATLLQRSVRNAVVLKDHGMVPFIKIFLDDACYRGASLSILEQLSVINAEEYMSIIVGALCSSTQGELPLKLDLLKSLLRILETPKGRAAFRVSSGFNGLLSLLSDLEGSLQEPPPRMCGAISPSHALDLTFHTLCAMSAALYLDPINSDFFRRKGLFEKLAEDICLLGCFGAPEEEAASLHCRAHVKPRPFSDLLSTAFSSSSPFPAQVRSCLQILSFLDSMARGSLHLQRDLEESLRGREEPIKGDQKEEVDRNPKCNFKQWPDLEERTEDGDVAIMHPGMVCIVVQLLPLLYHQDHPQLTREIQCSVASHIQSLVKSEKNRQLMCEAGLLRTLMSSCHQVLASNNHPLHLGLIRIFEKLASQAIEPDVLRQFLALGISLPLSTATKILSSSGRPGGGSGHPGTEVAVPGATESPTLDPPPGSPGAPREATPALHTALSLVSMTSPRNLQPQRAALAPSFVEFEMTMDGYGCLFIPTLSTVMGASAEYSVSGGIGTGAPRMFPPPGGLTFSCWFLLSRPGAVSKGHPLRFLTLVRHLSRTDQAFVCFSVSFCPDSLSLVVSTEEKELQPLDVMEPEDDAEPSAGRQLQIRCGQLLACGQWYHLVVVVTKEVKRNCTVSTYLDGQLIGSAKMLYIQALPGPFLSMEPSSFVDVYGYIATPRVWKQKSALTWRLGPTYLFEEAISMETLEIINKLGPRYCGNFQAVQAQGEDSGSEATPLVAEEGVSFGLNVASSCITTIVDIRNAYNEVDSRLIAKEMNISSRDSAMPVFLLRNCAGHLSGSLRTLGAVAVGQLGVRVFHCSPAASSLDFIGGPALLLGLTSLAADEPTMYAAVKVLHSVLTSNAMCDRLMRHLSGYQIMAFLLRKKTSLLNHRIFQLLLSIIGTAELGFGSSAITNVGIFQHILCNFELWMSTADNLDLTLFSHLAEIFRSPREGPRNAEVAHQAQLIPKLVFLFSEPSLSPSKVPTIIAILGHQLKGHFSIQDLLRIGLFVMYTLKPASVNEGQISMEGALDPSMPAGSQTSGKTIWLRNQLLEMLLSVISYPQLHLSSELKEEVFLHLGPDWFLLLIQGHLHPSTTVLGLKLLLHFLSAPSLRRRFRDGLPAGSWVENSTAGVDLLMDNLKSHPPAPEQSPCLLLGFRVLSEFLVHHVRVPQVYLIVSTFFLQTPLTELRDEPRDSLDAMLQWLLQKHHEEEVLRNGLCLEGALLLLEMLKATMSQPWAGAEDGAWERTFPASLLQFLGLVHRTYPQDPVWRAPEFLQTLVVVTFPLGASKASTAESTRDPAAEGDGSAEGPRAPADVHPTPKQLRRFLQQLLRELLVVAPAPKQWQPLDVLLEAPPDCTTSQQRRDFQSEVLLTTMEIFHFRHDGSMPMPSGGNEPQLPSEAATAPSLINVSSFTQKLVEKLYRGMFTADPGHILLFITEHIMMVIEYASSQKEAIISALYSSLNKVILYCLSKPWQSLTECLSLLSVLNFLQEHWDIVFATYNSNVSFLLCLMHCLLLLNAQSCPEGFGLERKPRMTPYHQVFLSLNEEAREKREEDFPSLNDVQCNIQKAVRTLWQQLVAQRRQTLEDALKIDLSVKPGESEVKIGEITPLWEETILKAWQHYLASEKKTLGSRSNAASHSKVTSWSGSLSSAMRLIPGRPAKDTEYKPEDFVSCIENYRRKGQELYASLYKDHVQRQRCSCIKAANAWARIREQLFGELGLWGQAAEAVPCPRWELDWREGPSRMRRRIRRLSPLDAPSQACHKEHRDRNYISQTNAENQAAAELTPKEDESEIDEVAVDCTQLTFFPALHESQHSEDFLELCRERKVVLQELIDQEKVTLKYSLVVVQGHLVSEGVLLLGCQHFYICENFTLSPVGDVYCTRHCLSNISDPFIFNMCSKDRSSDHYSCQRHSYGDIRDIYPARFLLQDIALEIFFQNGYSKFLVFHNGDRCKVFKSFHSFQPSLKGKGITEDPITIRRHPGSDRTMLQRWQKREISNFEYLMYLNTLSGRTYNDYMQYPVFPWVLADYTSETLNLTNPKTFRDLSKPMGAQTKERKLKFIQRFKEVEKTEGDMTVQCHYCTHYSSAIIVASYLVRMPPFTQAFCSLQGGSFDVADRMFHSVKSAWESASRENMSDVRELTPEFFYLPEFLTNCNAVEFGCMQDGTALGDVQLPPWADGDPRKFISLHRQALESDFVSASLHHWIDLIFGYKQQGPAAMEAVNTFHPYFYGDKMDLSSISDPLIKNTILGFVSNFGQVPKQLFSKPHPARTPAGKPSSGKDASTGTGTSLPGQPQPFFYSLQSLKPSQVMVKDMYLFSLGSESPKGAIGHIVPTEKTILAVEKNKVLLPRLWNRTFSWGFDDFSCCLGSYGSDKILMTFENLAAWGRCLCAVGTSPTTIVTSGASAVVCVWELSMTRGQAKGLRLKQALYGHTQPVTCLAASVAFSLLVSGSQDRTCILWDLDHLAHVARLPPHCEGISALAISDISGTIVSCAGAHLSLWNVNGQPLASITTAWGPEGAMTCCCMMEGPAWDTSHVIITGSQDGIVRIWKTEDVKMSVPGQAVAEEPLAQPPSPRGPRWEKNLALCRELDVSVALTGKPSKASPAVTALAVSRNQTKLYVGDEKGRIFCWSADG
ncbi:WD repeat- and FYVE domain-containing protein 4 isoform X3 [Tamandua tetradactyla]